MKRICGTSGVSDDGSPSTRCGQPVQNDAGTCNDCAEEAEILASLEPSS